MFNIEDYLIVNTTAAGGLNQNSTLTAEISVDKKKIKEDVKLFKYTLEQLEKIIGPYTIKVNSKKTKIKKKKKKND